jgi:hypothetical protein
MLTRTDAYYSRLAFTTNQSVTATSLTSFPSQTTLTFTPLITATYRVLVTVAAYSNTAGLSQNALVVIRATTGSPTYLAYGDAYLNTTVNGNAVPLTAWVDVTLTGGTAYTFSIQGSIAAGTLFLENSGTANGTYITAQQLN